MSRTHEAILESCVMFLLYAYFKGSRRLYEWIYKHNTYTTYYVIYVDTCSYIQTAELLKGDITEGDEKLTHTSIWCPKHDCISNFRIIKLLNYINTYNSRRRNYLWISFWNNVFRQFKRYLDTLFYSILNTNFGHTISRFKSLFI